MSQVSTGFTIGHVILEEMEERRKKRRLEKDKKKREKKKKMKGKGRSEEIVGRIDE